MKPFLKCITESTLYFPMHYKKTVETVLLKTVPTAIISIYLITIFFPSFFHSANSAAAVKSTSVDELTAVSQES